METILNTILTPLPAWLALVLIVLASNLIGTFIP